MSTERTIADIEAAADLLESEQVGWCKGVTSMEADHKLHVCAVGALRYVIGGSVFLITDCNPDWYFGRLVPALGELTKVLQGRNVADFNDSGVVTKQDVIDLFKGTAKHLRNQSTP